MSGDPRVYFAAERTLLAWVRTGIAAIGLGFVVARFALFRRLLDPALAAVSPTGPTVYMGSGLVLLGAFSSAIAAWQFLHFLRSLAPADRPSPHAHWPAVLLSIGLAVLGVLLGLHLVS
ncbi:MAG: DUF202 domain-containing protein [Gemmatimonadales bacterium]